MPTQAPLPSQARPVPHPVPAGAKAMPQRPAVQVRVPQALSLPGQAEAVKHCTHEPEPSQTLLPPQVVPAGWGGGLEQAPLDGSQAPAVWHGPGAGHVTELLDEQMPDWQASASVQAFPSLQRVPFETGGFRQMPLDGSQVPGTWHWSEAVHVMGVPGIHAPAVQTSYCVHVFPSLHGVPLENVVRAQTPVAGTHTPAV